MDRHDDTAVQLSPFYRKKVFFENTLARALTVLHSDKPFIEISCIPNEFKDSNPISMYDKKKSQNTFQIKET